LPLHSLAKRLLIKKWLCSKHKFVGTSSNTNPRLSQLF